MAFTYGDAPSSTRRDRFRLGVGDTENWGNLSLSDAEADYILATYTDDMDAWIAGCEFLAARCARYCDNTNIGISVQASQRFGMLKEMARTYRARRSAESTYADMLRVPGVSRTAQDRIDGNSDYLGNQFRLGQDDNPTTNEDGIEEE